MKILRICVNFLLVSTVLFACTPIDSADDLDNTGMNSDITNNDSSKDQTAEGDPSTPGDPTMPDKPSEPGDPTTPDNPSEPGDPTTPDKPTDPEEPKPEIPETPKYPQGVAVFDDLAVGTKVDSTRLSSNGIAFYFDERCRANVEIVESPFGEGYALMFDKNDTANGASVVFPYSGSGSRIVCEFDMSLSENKSSIPLQINLGSSYRLQFSVSLEYMIVNDASRDGKKVQFLGGYRTLGDAIHIRVEYYYGDGTAATNIAKVYIDGTLVAISHNFMYETPNNSNQNLSFYSLLASDSVLYIDNVSVFCDNVSFTDDGDESVKRFPIGGDSSGNAEAINKEIIGEEGILALRDLESIFDERVYIWLANLYDPITGGFYYSNDARDYEGFLPDAESTKQAMNLLQAIGLGKPDEYYTDEMAARLVAWVQSLQSEEDGYFYHPQWGTDIPIGRRGRDYSWCTGLLNLFGAEPLYTLALDRIPGAKAVSLTMPLKTQRSTVIATAKEDIPENNSHVKSPEALIAYLDNLYNECSTFDADGNFVDLNSYTFCGTVGVTTGEIKAAGLSDVLIDYLDSKQIPETGLWEKNVDYRAASGILKISGVYNSCERPFLYVENLVDSMIEIIKSEEPLSTAVYAYNPVAGLVNILTNVQKYGSGSNALRVKVGETLRASACDIILNTKNKLESFKRDDGSFSYNYTGAPAVSAGVTVCYGGVEGDINGCGLVNSTITNLYTLFGLNRPPMFGEEDKEAFREILHNAQPVVKKKMGGETIDFEGRDTLPTEVSVAMNSDGSYKLVTEDGNTSLEITKQGKGGDSVRFVAGEREGDDGAYVFSADLTYVSANNTIVSQIFFTSRSSFAINIGFAKGLLYIQEHKNSDERAVLISGVDVIGKTLHIEVKYYPNEKRAEISLEVDGNTYTAETSALFNEMYYNDPLDLVKFYMLNSAIAIVRIDNVDVYSTK